MKKNIIVVTGGAGFVGSNLIEYLVKKTSYQVISIDNYLTGTKRNHIKNTKVKYIDFFKAISPAQMLAFSTSSSAATLPVTMERCEEHLGVSEEVSSFVLPLGATINMDGTSLYQAVAAVFIAQAFGYDLDLAAQLTIVLTATLASIGAAAVPGAGMIMLVIVLSAIGIDPEGIALIFAVDRILDMMRTVVNVTGDATVATIVASTEGQLRMVSEEELMS